ncbi:MAG: hypothetical protein ACI8YQ_005154 [Polaribacter sp.]|jgi:hypothetical protein
MYEAISQSKKQSMKKRHFTIVITKSITIILLIVSSFTMQSQSISLSTKAFFNKTSFIRSSGSEEEFNTFSNYGASIKFKAKQIIGFETGIRYERKRNDRLEANYLIFPFRVLFFFSSEELGLDIGAGIFSGKSLSDRYGSDIGRILSANLHYQFNSRISFFIEAEHLRGWNRPYQYNGSPGNAPGGGAYESRISSFTTGLGITYRLVGRDYLPISGL